MKVILSVLFFTCVYSACDIHNTGFTDVQKQLILQKHNELRSRVAIGLENNQPSAQNMQILTWNEDLSKMAQAYTERCIYKHGYPKGIGENLYLWACKSKQFGKFDPTEPTQRWYDEVTKVPFPPELVTNYQYFPSAGHYSQIVWANTKEIGCGISEYIKNGKSNRMVSCYYNPTGNYRQQQVYEPGPACGNCPNGLQCNQDYPGLCGETVDLIPPELMPPPINYENYGIDDEILSTDHPDYDPACHIQYKKLTDQQKDSILNKHNYYRNKVANGEEKTMPKAANMNILTWNDKLAATAQEYVLKCKLQHSIGSGYGENLWMYGTTSDIFDEFLGEEVVTAWYNQGLKIGFPEKDIDPFQFVPQAAHFSQILWADTTEVGCGIAEYLHYGESRRLIACRYVTQGNKSDQRLYQVGDPCSNCSGGCTKEYSGLCYYQKGMILSVLALSILIVAFI